MLITGAPQPGVGISGTVGYSIKDLIALEGTIFMYFGFNEATRQVLAEFGLSGSLSVLSYELAAFTAFVNNNVLAGCGKLGELKGWAAYKFAGRVTEFGFGGCDNIAKYSLVPELAGLARRGPRARIAAAKLEVPAGVDWANLELRADSGLARATIEGPGGVTYTVPDTPGLTGDSSDPIVVLDRPGLAPDRNRPAQAQARRLSRRRDRRRAGDPTTPTSRTGGRRPSRPA